MKKNRRIRDTDARRLDEGEKSRQRIRNDEFRIRRSRALGRVLRTLYKDRFQNSLDRAFVPFSISTANATYTSSPFYLSFSLYFFFYSSCSSLLSEYIFILFSCVNTSPYFLFTSFCFLFFYCFFSFLRSHFLLFLSLLFLFFEHYYQYFPSRKWHYATYSRFRGKFFSERKREWK